MKTLRTILLLTFVLVLSACNFSLAADVTPPPGQQQPASQSQPEPVSGPLYPLVPPNPANGAPIYEEKCAPCHGETGQGDGPNAAKLPNPVAALGDPRTARQALPSRWYQQVTEGNLDRFMPPFASLSDRQRWDVVAYALTLSTSPASIQQGADLYTAQCAKCHGDSGKGDGPDAASLAKAPRSFADPAYMAEKSAADLFQAISQGAEGGMPAFGDQLNESERWALADFLRSLTFSEGEPAAASTPVPNAGSTPQASVEISATSTISGTGIVDGQVINGSGGALPSGLEVILHGYDEMQLVYSQTVPLQPDGSYVFTKVPMPVGRAFITLVDYNATTYGSDVFVAEAGGGKLSTMIEIYDTTTDPSVISGDRLHLFFEFLDNQTVRVIELYILSNNSNKTLVPPAAGEPSLTFKLPSGSANLQFQDGELGGRYLQTADGFGDTLPVEPGQGAYQVLYGYEMPYKSKLELVHEVNIPIGAIVILVPEGSIKIKGDRITDGGISDVQGTQYHIYNGSALQPGDELSLTMTGKPASGAPTLGSSSTSGMVIGLAVFGIALIVAGIWLFRRSRGSQEQDDEGLDDSEDDDSQENSETVMDAILTLDDLYREGKLSDEAYHQRRAELKARLEKLINGG